MTNSESYIYSELTAAIELRREQMLQSIPGSGEHLADLIVEVLEWTGQALHVEKLRPLIRHRYEFGANSIAEICTACRQESRIERTAKGTYGLTAWRTNTFGDGLVADKVVRLLEKSQCEMHYVDIYLRLCRETGVEAGGMNPPNSILPRFSRDPRLRQLGQGMYGLEKWYGQEQQNSSATAAHTTPAGA